MRLVGAGVLVLALLATALLEPSPSRTQAQGGGQPTLVVVATAMGISDIDLGALRRVFEGYATEYRGVRLIAFNQNVGTPARTSFDRAVLGLGPDQVGRFWMDQKIRQASQPPRVIPSPELVVRVVVSLRGGVGYLIGAPKDLPKGVRHLSINGKAPTDPGYPLSPR
ncbi:MAG TPA: hypothetical protein VJV78_12710 [Polyangiales bacterium]|nr:hypothetical protein [Polyangiales bacterium]